MLADGPPVQVQAGGHRLPAELEGPRRVSEAPPSSVLLRVASAGVTQLVQPWAGVRAPSPPHWEPCALDDVRWELGPEEGRGPASPEREGCPLGHSVLCPLPPSGPLQRQPEVRVGRRQPGQLRTGNARRQDPPSQPRAPLFHGRPSLTPWSCPGASHSSCGMVSQRSRCPRQTPSEPPPWA